MKQTLAYIRTSLAPLYPKREIEAIIRLIFESLKGWRPVDIVLNEDKPLSTFMQSKIHDIVQRLLNREPIQYILGTAHFYGLDLHVAPGVLIPRPETAELVDTIVRQADSRPDLRVLDIGAGSGCIAIALARNLRFPQITAIDISTQALDIARQNAQRLKTNIQFIQADILQLRPDTDLYDIIVSNPPYIARSEAADMEANVLQYEPHKALFVPDHDPLIFYRAIAQYAQQALTPQGRLYFEINPLYASQITQLLQTLSFTDIRLTRDIHSRYRFIQARRR